LNLLHSFGVLNGFTPRRKQETLRNIQMPQPCLVVRGEELLSNDLENGRAMRIFLIVSLVVLLLKLLLWILQHLEFNFME
jgi:hypothetical protein